VRQARLLLRLLHGRRRCEMFLSRLWTMLRGLRRRESFEAERREEIQFHIEQRASDLERLNNLPGPLVLCTHAAPQAALHAGCDWHTGYRHRR
jgi:hypothetical protein